MGYERLGLEFGCPAKPVLFPLDYKIEWRASEGDRESEERE